VSRRLTAVALALALPLVGVAGCGAQKKRTIKAELQSAADHIAASEAMSVTFRLGDPSGTVKANLIDGAESADEKALTPTLLGSSVTYTVDPVGNATLKDSPQGCGTTERELRDSLEKVNFSLVLNSDVKPLGELRMVDGTLYVHVDLAEIRRLAAIGGTKDFDAQLDDFAAEDAELEKAVADVRAGKWVKVPVGEYIDRLQELAESFTDAMGEEGATPKAAPLDCNAVGKDVFSAIKPHIKVTDANNSSSDRVLDVAVQVRPALKAAVAALKGSKHPMLGEALEDFDPAEIDKEVADGVAKGTVKLSDGHLKQVTIDLESARVLDPKASGKPLTGGSVVIDVDDTAEELKAPTNLSSFDLGKAVEDFFEGFEEGFAEGFDEESFGLEG
jgi:hypothetical protein